MRRHSATLAHSLLRLAITVQLPDHVEAALRDYDRRRDRASPPVFVGRASELSFLHDAAAAAQSGAEGITAVVQGVPGVGKSALRRQFEQELRTAMADDRPVAVVAKDCDFFDRPAVSMVKELAADVPVRPLNRQGTTTVAVAVPSMVGYLADELDRLLAQGGVAARRLAGALEIR